MRVRMDEQLRIIDKILKDFIKNKTALEIRKVEIEYRTETVKAVDYTKEPAKTNKICKVVENVVIEKMGKEEGYKELEKKIKIIEKYIEMLPAEYKEVIKMYYIDKYSLERISEILTKNGYYGEKNKKVTINTVRSKRMKGLLHLKKLAFHNLCA